MDNQLSSKSMDQILADVMQNNTADLRALLTNNGVINASSLSDDDVRLAFLKAIKDSASFRSDLSSYLADLVQSKASFVNQPQLNCTGMQSFVDEPMLNFVNADSLEDAAMGATSTTTTTTTKSSGGFWDSLGSLASKENLQSLFNTGLGAASASLQNKANKSSEERALELERLRLQQIQAQTQLTAAGGVKKGLSAGAWIGIGVGAVVLITVIILLTRKKN